MQLLLTYFTCRGSHAVNMIEWNFFAKQGRRERTMFIDFCRIRRKKIIQSIILVKSKTVSNSFDSNFSMSHFLRESSLSNWLLSLAI